MGNYKFSYIPDQNATKAHLPPIQQDPRSEFYGHYHKEAEEYDKEFMEKYEAKWDSVF